jgi:hypothetical protein
VATSPWLLVMLTMWSIGVVLMLLLLLLLLHPLGHCSPHIPTRHVPYCHLVRLCSRCKRNSVLRILLLLVSC